MKNGIHTYILTSVRMPNELHDALRRLAYTEQVSMHSLLIEGAQEVVNKRERRRPGDVIYPRAGPTTDENQK